MLRGHRDANCSSHNATNKGNFKAILQFRNLGNPAFRQHLEHGKKNAQYTSPRMKNEIIAISKLLSMRNIAEKVRENELYSIIYDECTDVSNKEQLSLRVRFVHVTDEQKIFVQKPRNASCIHEEFLVFF